MMAYWLVFLGGGLGSICRYGIAHALAFWRLSFPLATLIANVASCVLLGVLAGWGLKGGLEANYRWFFISGFCGGFSTFSTFSNETFLLFQSGQSFLALANIVLNLSICLLAIYLGIRLVY